MPVFAWTMASPSRKSKAMSLETKIETTRCVEESEIPKKEIAVKFKKNCQIRSIRFWKTIPKEFWNFKSEQKMASVRETRQCGQCTLYMARRKTWKKFMWQLVEGQFNTVSCFKHGWVRKGKTLTDYKILTPLPVVLRMYIPFQPYNALTKNHGWRAPYLSNGLEPSIKKFFVPKRKILIL